MLFFSFDTYSYDYFSHPNKIKYIIYLQEVKLTYIFFGNLIVRLA